MKTFPIDPSSLSRAQDARQYAAQRSKAIRRLVHLFVFTFTCLGGGIGIATILEYHPVNWLLLVIFTGFWYSTTRRLLT